MITLTKLKESLKRVKSFKVMDVKTGVRNKFYLSDYKVPIVDGISKFEYNKGIDKVKPSTLEYIILNLHNVDEDMVVDALEVLMYYWRIKKKNPRTMKIKFKEIVLHYTIKHDEEIPCANIEYVAIVYSISFNIGSIRINKFGITTDKDRYKKLISDARSKYELVSIGNFVIHQEIQFKTIEQAKAIEKEAISNLKKNQNYRKCKNCFDGYNEAYLH